MFGCFGKKKKKNKEAKSSPVDKNSNNNQRNLSPDALDSPKSKAANQSAEPIEESINVQRTQSLLASAAPPIENRGNIQKSATLARYDFLRKSDYISTADRWLALKKQYLEPSVDHSAVNGSVPTGGNARTTMSLPRQFSPPSTVISPVKFSNWFYDRQVKEEEARKEFHDREERLRKVLEGTIDEEKHSHDDAEFAATKIQAGFRGYQTRKNLNGKAESDSQPQELPQPEEEEEVDIDLEDPEVRVAALKIQKGFKNFHAAKKRPANSEANLSSSLQNDLSGKETKPEEAEAQAEVQETPKEDNVPEQDLDDPELNTAATKIQASFKGFQARKQVEGMKKEKEEQQPSVEQPSTESETIEASTHDNEEVPEDDREAAAIKIQAGFKGYKTRKDMGKVKPKEGEAAVNDSTE